MLAKGSQASGTGISYCNAYGLPDSRRNLSLKAAHRKWTEAICCLSCQLGITLPLWQGPKKPWCFLLQSGDPFLSQGTQNNDIPYHCLYQDWRSQVYLGTPPASTSFD